MIRGCGAGATTAGAGGGATEEAIEEDRPLGLGVPSSRLVGVEFALFAGAMLAGEGSI